MEETNVTQAPELSEQDLSELLPAYAPDNYAMQSASAATTTYSITTQ